jgi:hypothetical protein
MEKSNIQLEGYTFKKLSCEWQDGEISDGASEKLSITYNVFFIKETPERFRLDFYVQWIPNKGKRGLKIDAHMEGHFKFPKDTDADVMQRLIRINGGTILYSTLRGHITNLSANFIDGPVYLPAIVMADVVEYIEGNRKN